MNIVRVVHIAHFIDVAHVLNITHVCVTVVISSRQWYPFCFPLQLLYKATLAKGTYVFLEFIYKFNTKRLCNLDDCGGMMQSCILTYTTLCNRELYRKLTRNMNRSGILFIKYFSIIKKQK